MIDQVKNNSTTSANQYDKKLKVFYFHQCSKDEGVFLPGCVLPKCHIFYIHLQN